MKKIITRLSVSILLICYLVNMKAFSGNIGETAPQILSANAYLLSKYGDIPVNYSTGVPDISIPLMTFEDRDLKLGISLSYHASGIKVDEEAPWTGLGWSLNAGGIITRVIRGVADLPNRNGDGLFGERTSIQDYNYQGNFASYRNQTYPELQAAATNQIDNNPDIFFFNFAGHSGKFFFDDNLSPCFFEHQDFKVQYIDNPSNYREPDFVITTDDGVVYEFKEKERVFDYSIGGWNVTGWYLTKITSPAGGQMTLSYRMGGNPSYQYQQRESDVHFMAIHELAPHHSITETYNKMRPTAGVGTSCYVLKEIISGNGCKIKFNQTSSSRLDSEGSFGDMLNEIVLFDSQDNQQKKFTLHYNYFEADNNHKTKASWSTGMNFLNYRLRLDSLREVSKMNNTYLTHKFEYYYNPNPNPNLGDPYSLPYRLSPCQDHWGYYNYSHNETIFPNNPKNRRFHVDEWYERFLPEPNPPMPYSYLIQDGGNREPDVEAVKAGSLKKIIYPTGGFVSFDYEPHGYNPSQMASVGGIRIKQITNSNGEIKRYEYVGDSFVSSNYPLERENQYYTHYYQNDVTLGSGRPKLMAGFGIPVDVYRNNAFILKMDSRPQAVLGSGPVMVYGKVIEIIPGNGRTEYEFSYSDDWDNPGWGSDMDGIPLTGNFYSGYLTSASSPGYPEGMYESATISSNVWPYPEKISVDWRRGKLELKTIYSEEGQRLQTDSIEYDFRALKAVPGYKVAGFGEDYVYARNYTVGGQVKVKREVSKQYLADGSEVRTVTEYDYSESPHKKMKEQRVWNSDGSKLTTKYYYPTEYSSGLFTSLINKNMLYPIDTRTYKDNKLISGNQVQFDEKGNPVVIYKANFEVGVNDIPFNNSNPYTFSPYMTSTYFPSGLLSSFKSNSEIPVTYLWSYNRQYPIAKIEGATYSLVEAAIVGGANTIAVLETSAIPDMSSVDALRAALPNALITTYTYKPLVGIASVTDPRGVKTTYEYDDFGRLEWIKDMNGNIIESYEYNYQNQ